MLGANPLGDITQDGRTAHHLSLLVADGCARQIDNDATPVLGEPLGLVIPYKARLAHLVVQPFQLATALDLSRNDGPKMVANDLVGSIAKDHFRASVPGQHPALII